MRTLKQQVTISWISLDRKVKSIIEKLVEREDGFGLNELLGIAAAIIIAGIIFIPQLKNFADSVMDKLASWWTSVQDKIFVPIL